VFFVPNLDSFFSSRALGPFPLFALLKLAIYISKPLSNPSIRTHSRFFPPTQTLMNDKFASITIPRTSRQCFFLAFFFYLFHNHFSNPIFFFVSNKFKSAPRRKIADIYFFFHLNAFLWARSRPSFSMLVFFYTTPILNCAVFIAFVFISLAPARLARFGWDGKRLRNPSSLLPT